MKTNYVAKTISKGIVITLLGAETIILAIPVGVIKAIEGITYVKATGVSKIREVCTKIDNYGVEK